MSRAQFKALFVPVFALVLAAGATMMAGPAAQAAPWMARAAAPGVAATAIPGELNAVSASSSTNAWAVGQNCTATCTTLTVHWNGTAWSKVTSPNASSGGNALSGVYTVSATNAWAVGDYCTTSACAVEDTLILHWNGTTWSKVPSPNPSSIVNILAGVSGSSAGDIWAAGYMIGASGSDNTLIVHWNGTSWSKVASPNPSKTGANSLQAVSAVSSATAWAVGNYDATASTGANLALRWNGTAWSKITTPNPSATFNSLTGVSATSAGDAWAVGIAETTASGSALILRWNGTAWSKVKSPNPAGAALSAVSADSATDAWAVGDYCVSSCGGPGAVLDTMTLRWNGTSWSKIKSPSPGSTGRNLLFGVSATSPTSAWAVGANPNGTTLILRWNGTSWSQA
jgi:hypothetical protein